MPSSVIEHAAGANPGSGIRFFALAAPQEQTLSVQEPLPKPVTAEVTAAEGGYCRPSTVDSGHEKAPKSLIYLGA
jgi:hypothetical protein